jgi:hypothetical protein
MDDQPSKAPDFGSEPLPAEGLELIRVFCSIKSMDHRSQLLQIAKSYVRVLEKHHRD